MAHLCQTIIGITNEIGFSKTRSINNNNIDRRVVIYRMGKSLWKLKPFCEGSITNLVRLQFIAMAQSVSSAYESPPMLLEIALETEFKNSVKAVRYRAYRKEVSIYSKIRP